jgi:hypothetical protein
MCAMRWWMGLCAGVLAVSPVWRRGGAIGRVRRQEGPFAQRAGDLLRARVRALLELDGYEMRYGAFGIGNGIAWEVRGRGEVAVFEGDLRIYANGDRMLVERNGSYARPEDLDDVDGVRACLAIHPRTILTELERLHARAEYAGEETLPPEGRACRVITVPGDARLALAHLQQMLQRTRMYRARAGDLLRRLVPQKTTMRYRVFLDAQTAEIVRINWGGFPAWSRETRSMWTW